MCVCVCVCVCVLSFPPDVTQGVPEQNPLQKFHFLTPWNRVMLQNLSLSLSLFFFVMENIFGLSRNLQNHCLLQNGSSRSPVLSQNNPAHTLTPCFFNVAFNTVNQSTLRPSKEVLKGFTETCYTFTTYSMHAVSFCFSFAAIFVNGRKYEELCYDFLRVQFFPVSKVQILSSVH